MSSTMTWNQHNWTSWIEFGGREIGPEEGGVGLKTSDDRSDNPNHCAGNPAFRYKIQHNELLGPP